MQKSNIKRIEIINQLSEKKIINYESNYHKFNNHLFFLFFFFLLLEERKKIFSALNADQVATLLVVSNEYHLCREAMIKLIGRIASEDKNDLKRLKLSQLLPTQVN